MAVETRAPISDITVTGTWSSTAGNRYTLVDDYPDSAGADYLTHGTTAGAILFGFAPLSIPVNAFAISVQVRYYDRKAATAANQISGRLRVGGATYDVATHNTTQNVWVSRSDNWAVNPRTGTEWTPNDINGVGSNALDAFGLRTSDANPAIGIASIQLQVTYQVPGLTVDPASYTVEGNTYSHRAKVEARDLVDVEVGDLATPGEFFPQAKLKRWNNEANVSIRLVDAGAGKTHSINNGIIEYKSGTARARWYQVTPAAFLGDDNGLEMEIFLGSKPPVNTLQFTVSNKNIEWWYQPPLANVEADGSSWEIDAEGARHERSAEVSGSYALYWPGHPINTTEGAQYRTGKIGHLYRPKAIDALGATAWGTLSYDSQIGILTASIPQAFLDSATYPVVIDPTIGYTTTAGTTYTSTGSVYAAKFTASSSGDANPGTMYLYGRYLTNANRQAHCGIWSDSSAYPGASLISGPTVTFDNTSAAWKSGSITWTGISSGTVYWLGGISDTTTNLRLYYDAGGVNQSYFKADTNFPTLPNPFPASATGAAAQFGVYVEYAESAALPCVRYQTLTQAVNRAATY